MTFEDELYLVNMGEHDKGAAIMKTAADLIREDTLSDGGMETTAMHVKELHKQDFYSWAVNQAAAIRSGQLSSVDLENVAEEIETLGRSEKSALESAYRLICLHQLKRLFQPERADSRSWTLTIGRERLHAARLLEDNPGLKPLRQQLFARAYADGRKEAALETGLPAATFPKMPPFTLEQISDETFWAAEPNPSKDKPAR